jgi:hypothetical protein
MMRIPRHICATQHVIPAPHRVRRLNTVFYALQRDEWQGGPANHPLKGSVEARLSDRFPVRRRSAFAERGRRLWVGFRALANGQLSAMSGHLQIKHEDLP